MSLPKPAPATQILVTGASSGIGAEIARLLAGRGYDLALVARRRDRLEALATELRVTHGIGATIHEADLGRDRPRRALIAELTGSDAPATVGLVNCAGFGSSGAFLELDRRRELEQIDVNVRAVVELNHALARPMVARESGAILNVASIAAFQPLPRFAIYSASKAFVQTFSEALHEELRGTGVSCTVLCPGPVDTEWADIANAGAVMLNPVKMPVGAVAAAAVLGMTEGKRSVVPGILPQATATAGRFLPRRFLLPAFGRLASRSTDET